MNTIKQYVDVPPPQPGAPGMFRCAAPGLMKDIFEKAGFKNVEVKPIASKLDSGDVETYWEMMTDVAAPVVAALSKADEATREKIKQDVFKLVKQEYPDHVAIKAGALVISAQK